MAKKSVTKSKKGKAMQPASTGRRGLFKGPGSALTVHRIKIILPIIVALVCGAVGSYLLFHSKAATSEVVVEAETLTLPAGSAVITDTAARSGQAIVMHQSGTASGSITTTGPVATIQVKAKATTCKGSPQFTLSANGKTVMTQSVGSSSWTLYSAAVSIPAGTSQLQLTYTNDLARGKCDRDLYIDYVSFVEQANRPPVANITPSQTVTTGTLVNIYAATSSDPDGDPLTFSWREVSGPTVALTQVDQSHVTFTPAVTGSYVIEVTVSDGKGGTASKQTTVTVVLPTSSSSPTTVKGESSTSTVEPRLLTDPNVLWVGTFDNDNWKNLWGVSFNNYEEHQTVADYSSAIGSAGKALRVLNVAKQQNGFGFNANFVSMGLAEQDEVYLRYRIYFPSDYPWINAGGGGGGKLPGLAGKIGLTYAWAVGGGGKRWNENVEVTKSNLGDATGFSSRLYWQKDHGMSDYIYVVDPVGVSSTNSYFGNSQRVKTSLTSTTNAQFKTGWNTVEQYIKLNTPGVADGVEKVWLNGTLGLQRTNVEHRSASRPNLKISQIWMSWFYGGPTTDYPDRDAYVYFDDFVLSKAYIGPRVN